MEKVSILVTDLVLSISVGSLDPYIPAGLTVYLGAGQTSFLFSLSLPVHMNGDSDGKSLECSIYDLLC
jgi:hypothetical protein